MSVAFADDAEIEYKCIKCGDKIDSLEALQRHLSVDHMRWVPYECLYCDMFKATETELRDHVTQRHPDRPVKLVVSSDAANQQQLRKLISQSTTRKSTLSATTTPVEMCDGGVAEKYVSSPSRDCSTERERRQPVAVKVEFVDLSNEEDEPPIKLSPPHTSEYTEAANEIAANESAEPRLAENGHGFDTPSVTSPGRVRRRRRLAPSRSVSRQSAGQTPAEKEAQVNTPASICRKRRVHYRWLDTSRCRLCQVDKAGFGGTPVLHVYVRHMDEDAVFCKYCGLGVRYSISEIRRHIRLRHPRDVVESGIVDKRQQLEPTVHAWMQRCYGTDNENEVAVEAATSASATARDLVKRQRLSGHLLASRSRARYCCFLCEKDFSEHPSQHVYTKHIKAKVWRCKLCCYGTARRDYLTVHLRNRHHETDDPKTFVDDRREEFRQQFEQWHKRCFGETTAASSTDRPLHESRADGPSDHSDVTADTREDKESSSDESRQSNTDSQRSCLKPLLARAGILS